jgi:hypothetical protein
MKKFSLERVIFVLIFALGLINLFVGLYTVRSLATPAPVVVTQPAVSEVVVEEASAEAVIEAEVEAEVEATPEATPSPKVKIKPTPKIESNESE